MSHDSYRGVPQEEVQAANDFAALMALLQGETPRPVTAAEIAEWQERWEMNGEASFPMPHLGYLEPEGFRKVGPPIRVVADYEEAGGGDVLNITEFLATVRPGYWAIAEYRPGDVDVQRWIPSSE